MKKINEAIDKNIIYWCFALTLGLFIKKKLDILYKLSIILSPNLLQCTPDEICHRIIIILSTLEVKSFRWGYTIKLFV